jgi:hypothetical protein
MRLPTRVQEFFDTAYQNSYARTQDEVLSSRTAWEVTKANLNKFPQEVMYSCSIKINPEMFVSNSETGEIELNAVLATTEPRHDDGKYFTEVELQEIADQINAEGSGLPDEEHRVLEAVKARVGNNPALIREELKKEKGIFKSIKAIVEKGKLWIKALLDKRYKNHVNKYTSLSIEATATHAGNGRLVKPKYVSFTFTDTPQLAGASIAA